MARTVRILGIHGLGHQKVDWYQEWTKAVEAIYTDSDLTLQFDSVFYDPIFESVRLSPLDLLGAVAKLGWSGVTHLFRRERGLLGDIEETVKWTAGYVVAWTENKSFQAQTRKLFLDKVRAFKPDIILAHSLGTLVSYNAISHDDAKEAAAAAALKKAHYVTFGSQIGNPFVIGNLSHGRVQPLAVLQWHHLYNHFDPVFTAPLRVPSASNFMQILTPFDDGGLKNHSSPRYISHPETVGAFWLPYAARPDQGVRGYGLATRPAERKKARPARAPARKRALLVGINDYVNASDRLEGCVNDVFTMSAVLQESGFEADDIRTCLDRRATAKGIIERMEWLVDDIHPGDERVFYYSGHGAQLPVYGPSGEPDRMVETLVPCDFDWSPETSITDEHIYGLYSQLPYDTRLAMIFDCCHSGGVHRQGGARARGLTPPDDIRHRQLKWDIKSQMWVDRDFKRINDKFATVRKDNKDFFGEGGAKLRLGRAAVLRAQTTKKDYEEAKAEGAKAVGPYLPLIIEACGEDELSYEYRHGATSYGAFTFCLASILRERKSITFADLVKATSAKLADLQYGQTPQILGPGNIVGARVPWQTGAAGRSTPPASAGPGAR